MTDQMAAPETHWGTHPSHGGATLHNGRRENCSGPDCGNPPAEDAAASLEESCAVAEEFQLGGTEVETAELRLVLDQRRALLDERDRLRRQLDAAEAAPASVDQLYKLLADLVPLDEDGQDACWFDHHGGCQAHGYLELKPGERCPVAETRELLAGRLSPDAEP